MAGARDSLQAYSKKEKAASDMAQWRQLMAIHQVQSLRSIEPCARLLASCAKDLNRDNHATVSRSHSSAQANQRKCDNAEEQLLHAQDF
eukprot:1268405-Amphidinium_carterae.2